MEYEIVHHPERNRFEIHENGMTAFVEYLPYNGGIDLIHTIVPQAMQGRGIAAMLVGAAMKYARTHRLKVMPSCPYVPVYLERHPEDNELVDISVPAR